MPKFTVLHTPILHNGKRYDIGAEIELTAEQAENNSINLKAVADAQPPTPPEPPQGGDPELGGAVTENDVLAAEASLAAAEQSKTAKKSKK